MPLAAILAHAGILFISARGFIGWYGSTDVCWKTARVMMHQEHLILLIDGHIDRWMTWNCCLLLQSTLVPFPWAPSDLTRPDPIPAKRPLLTNLPVARDLDLTPWWPWGPESIVVDDLGGCSAPEEDRRIYSRPTWSIVLCCCWLITAPDSSPLRAGINTVLRMGWIQSFICVFATEYY